MSKVERTAWIYCRLGNGENSSTKIEAQRKQVEAYAYAKGYKVLGCTVGVGKSLEIAGPEMGEIERAVEKQGVNTLLVNDVARLSRRADEMLTLIDHMNQMGVKIENTQGEDLSNPVPIENIKVFADFVNSAEANFCDECDYEDMEEEER